MTSLRSYAFSGCTSLTSIVLPESVTSIGYRAFVGCRNLERILFPCNVTSISGFVFEGCDKLSSIACLAINPPVLDNLFGFTGTTIFVPESCVEAYKNADSWSDYADMIHGAIFN